MVSRPRVSVIIPAFNAEPFLGAAISSVLAQTYPDVETVVVDDGSSDGTEDIARAYGARVRYHRQPNSGAAAARNAGLQVASGDYIALCDADDMLLPHHIERALDVIAAAPPRTWVCSDALALSSHGIGGRVLPYGAIAPTRQRAAILQANFVSVFSLFPRRMVEEVGAFCEDLTNSEDWDLWARAVFTGWRVSVQGDPSALYRRHEGGKSRDQERMIRAEEAIFRRLRSSHGDRMSRVEREHLDRRLTSGSARHHLRQAEAALVAGDYGSARRLFGLASSDFPLDRRLRGKALLVRWVPGACRALHRRTMARRPGDGST